MEDIRRQDLRIFLREVVDPMRLAATAGGLIVVFLFAMRSQSALTFFPGACIVLLCLIAASWSAAERKRFYERRMQAWWNGCNDRLQRLEEVLKRMRRDQITDLREMPMNIRAVAHSLYLALRRADIIAHEVQASEREVINQPPSWNSASMDPQSRELY